MTVGVGWVVEWGAVGDTVGDVVGVFVAGVDVGNEVCCVTRVGM